MENLISGSAETAPRPNLQNRTIGSGVMEGLIARWFKKIETGRLIIEFPSGRQEVFEGEFPGSEALLKINSFRVVHRLLIAGDTGLAEGYIEGEWETPDLAGLLSLGIINSESFSSALRQSRVATWLSRCRHALRTNSKKGSRKNISAHYDLGNTFYRQWLDKTMSYSSGFFVDLNEDMEVAQRRKYIRMIQSLDLKRGDRILEIGCGWGGFAELAADEYDCEVVGLTLSKEQATYACERMARAGLSDKVDIRIQDYRDVTGKFDHIVSIEMFEAVGEEYWQTYLNVINERLKPGGRAALQIITINDEYFEEYRSNPDFIQRYIFPGGMLPSPTAFEGAVTKAGLSLAHSSFFGKSYGETLRRWDQSFRENWSGIEPLGFDQRFYRLWRYYLAYCEAGFNQDKINIGHFVIQHR
jgi:cyclopropane-fatty-acyl-phospholipid synthase